MQHGSFSIRYLAVAQEDLAEIVQYINCSNPNNAELFIDTIEKSIDRLSIEPNIGRIPNEDDIAGLGYRYLVIENYLVFYVVEDRVVIIHRVIHGARKYCDIITKQ